MPSRFRAHESPMNSLALESFSIAALIEDLLESHERAIVQQNIKTELDVQPIEVFGDQQAIRTALDGLIRNAIESTPADGEITITTIDGLHQWEVEVADSSGTGVETESGRLDEDDAEQDDLPMIFSFPATDNLRHAYRAAFELNGEVQSWTCPQGGVAYLLTVPRRRSNRINRK